MDKKTVKETFQSAKKKLNAHFERNEDVYLSVFAATVGITTYIIGSTLVERNRAGRYNSMLDARENRIRNAYGDDIVILYDRNQEVYGYARMKNVIEE